MIKIKILLELFCHFCFSYCKTLNNKNNQQRDHLGGNFWKTNFISDKTCTLMSSPHPPHNRETAFFFPFVVCLQVIFCEVCGVQSLSISNYWLMFGCDFMGIPDITLLWFYFLFWFFFFSFFKPLHWFFSEKNIPEVLSNLELCFSWLPRTLPHSVYCVCEDRLTCWDS